MPLSEDEERAEHERRMDQMAVNIEKMRADLALDSRKFQEELDYRSKMLRWEGWKFLVSALLASAALVGAGIAIGNYFTRTSQQSITVHLDQPLVSAPK